MRRARRANRALQGAVRRFTVTSSIAFSPNGAESANLNPGESANDNGRRLVEISLNPDPSLRPGLSTVEAARIRSEWLRPLSAEELEQRRAKAEEVARENEAQRRETHARKQASERERAKRDRATAEKDESERAEREAAYERLAPTLSTLTWSELYTDQADHLRARLGPHPWIAAQASTIRSDGSEVRRPIWVAGDAPAEGLPSRAGTFRPNSLTEIRISAFGCATRAEDHEGRPLRWRGSDLAPAQRWIYVDLDREQHESYLDVCARLEGSGLPPTTETVRTPSDGVQAYWRLSEPVPIDDARALSAAVCKVLRGDPQAVKSQSGRLPGTVRVKKGKLGVCRIDRARTDFARAYTAAALKAALPNLLPVGLGRSPTDAPEREVSDEYEWILATLSAALGYEVSAKVKHGRLLAHDCPLCGGREKAVTPIGHAYPHTACLKCDGRVSVRELAREHSVATPRVELSEGAVVRYTGIKLPPTAPARWTRDQAQAEIKSVCQAADTHNAPAIKPRVIFVVEAGTGTGKDFVVGKHARDRARLATGARWDTYSPGQRDEKRKAKEHLERDPGVAARVHISPAAAKLGEYGAPETRGCVNERRMARVLAAKQPSHFACAGCQYGPEPAADSAKKGLRVVRSTESKPTWNTCQVHRGYLDFGEGPDRVDLYPHAKLLNRKRKDWNV
jgi:hypothetical protein